MTEPTIDDFRHCSESCYPAPRNWDSLPSTSIQAIFIDSWAAIPARITGCLCATKTLALSARLPVGPTDSLPCSLSA